MKNPGKTVRVGALDDARNVRLEVRKLYREARRGEIETIDLTRLIAAMRVMTVCLVTENYEARIVALEKAEEKQKAERERQGYGRP